MTDFLAGANLWFGHYDPCLDLLKGLLKNSGQRQVCDLASGGGGPWERWLSRCWLDADVVLTDRYPNLEAFRALADRYENLSYLAQPVDATAVPTDLAGVRTLFTALHHFPPEVVSGMCRDAAESGYPLAVFDFSQRRWMNILLVPPIVFALCWLLTPLLRPFRWSRLLLTYLLPIVPAATVWDGLVSQLRAYTVDELRALVPEVPGYHWEIGVRKSIGPARVTYLIGRPKA